MGERVAALSLGVEGAGPDEPAAELNPKKKALALCARRGVRRGGGRWGGRAVPARGAEVGRAR